MSGKNPFNSAAGSVEIRPLDDGEVEVIFEDMQKSIAIGQSAVFYDGDKVLGGGVIKSAF